jgi:DNA-binding NarL/FixJ family response regulator
VIVVAASKIRVMLVDDHPVVREGLRSMLDEPGVEVVGEAGTGLEAVVKAERCAPDVILMDVRMPEMDGLSAMAAIKRARPQTAILVLSTYDNIEYIIRAVVGGASGYLLKGTPRQQMIQAIKAVAEGDSLLEPHQLHSVVSKALQEGQKIRGRSTSPAQPLTRRELEVVKLLVQGLTNKQIGDLLGVSASTIKTHVQSIIRKLGVSDRTQAAVWAVRNGMTQP